MSLQQIDHTTTNARPETTVFCTVCNGPVYVNRHGRCPKTVGAGVARTAGQRPEPRQPLVQVERDVLGRPNDRITCPVEGHGPVSLNKHGECPKCSLVRSATAWQAHYESRKAQESQADVTSEHVEAEAKSEAPADTVEDRVVAALQERLPVAEVPVEEPGEATAKLEQLNSEVAAGRPRRQSQRKK